MKTLLPSPRWLFLPWLAVVISPGMVESAGSDPITFSPLQMERWPTRSFAGETDYRLTEKDGERVLQARANGQASALYLEREIDLAQTPYLKWCWQVDRIYPGLNETTKAGDDYPGRVYVAHKTGLLPWQVQSVNYVWSSTQAPDSTWTNAFTDRAQLLALQGGDDNVGRWVAEVRHVREDYQRLFGESYAHIDGVAIMSDGDNAGGNATAWFTGLRFSADPTPPACPSP
ncbi:DUF3047 domain-containing protein [Halomonas vilamensis]|uniref:DUF3047 domain-containing protein n=1 Tax=Vreelandella vilamensis TaxID=531309 RepID=A0ABU1H035_9GAMM|nr:DUF3047 domain-containing protein [Halomonas vilamensis]MDR5897594.1 DUF3047 domain-containing protein [Halomonas vilamensis]